MKICIIPLMPSHKWGGSEEYWFLVATEALKLNYDVLIILERTEQVHNNYYELKKLGAKLFLYEKNINPILPKKISHKLMRIYRNYPRVPMFYINIMSTMKEFNPDILLINMGGTFSIMEYPVCLWLLYNYNKPYFLFSHNYNEHRVYPYPYLKRIRDMLKQIVKIYFISERNMNVAKRAVASRDFPECHVLNNLCKLGTLDPLPMPDQSKIKFASIARLTCYDKSQDILIEVLAQDKWKSRNWELSIFGKGDDEQYLNDLIQYFDLSDKVKLAGHNSKIIDIWEQHHMLLLSSQTEGTSQALIEAMMCGRPVMATDVGDSAKLVIEGETGFLADAATPKLIAIALERAWKSKENWATMGITANHKVIDFVDVVPGKTLLSDLKHYVEQNR